MLITANWVFDILLDLLFQLKLFFLTCLRGCTEGPISIGLSVSNGKAPVINLCLALPFPNHLVRISK